MILKIVVVVYQYYRKQMVLGRGRRHCSAAEYKIKKAAACTMSRGLQRCAAAPAAKAQFADLADWCREAAAV